MSDEDKTPEQLIDDLADLRRQVAHLEAEIARNRQAEADRREIDNNLPVIVATAGFDGYYQEVNVAFERILGWSRQELLSRPYMEFVLPEDRPVAAETLERLRSGGAAVHFVGRHVAKDGSHRWFDWIVSPLPNRGIMFGIGEDITERRRVEEALRESEQRYRQLADSTPDVIYILDETGRLLYANRAAGKYYGVSPESLVGKTQRELFPPEKVKIHLKRVQEAFETGHIDDREERYRFGDRDVWLNVRTIPLRDKQGRVASLMGVCRDITERKQAEEALKNAHRELEERVNERTSELTAANRALRESEAKFRTLVEMSPDAVFMGDLTGRVTYASRRALQMYGTDDAKDMLDRNPLEFFASSDHQKFLANLRRTLDEGVTRDVQYDIVRKDGTRFVGELSAAVIEDVAGKPSGFVAILRDVTERKQAEQSLQQSHDELQAIYDGMSDGLLIADVQSRKLVRANGPICRMLGYSRDEILSKSVVDIHPAKDLPAMVEKFRLGAEAGLRFTADMPMLRKDGSTFYADVSSERIVYDGRPCLIGFFRDTTERKQAQDAVERERQSLWRMLQASDHERQVIAYDIHDGLTQYLAAAGMQFQVYDSLRDSSPRDARKAYETAVELVRQAHAESRRLISEVRHPVIDERGLESAILSLVYEQRQRGGPRIECHTSVGFDRLPPILENALYRMVQEALTNACKHSKSKKVTVSLVQNGQDVELTVQDWGTGFDAEAVGKDHFGLESIRQRTRLLGGRLSIESSPGGGARVHVVVPILEERIDPQ